MREKIIVLGATGSIGTQCLDILRFSSVYELVGVSFSSRYEILEDYLLYFDSLKYVAIADEEKAKEFQKKHPSYIVLAGEDSSLELVKTCSSCTVFNSLLGNCGLRPTLAAIRNQVDIMLSNKESLVIGSDLIKEELKHSKSHIYPVDSEHVALAKLLSECEKRGIARENISKLIVTASGGALRDFKKEDLAKVSPETVLKHPTWAMGAKITCDSATLVNKGFECIEASILFDYPLEKVGAIICRESLVHAQVEYIHEGRKQLLQEYSPVSMSVPIAYALSKGELGMHINNSEDEEAIQKLHFQEIDYSFYPAFSYTIDCFKQHGNVGMIYYNAVDTEAINAFLKGEISYLDIIKALKEISTHMPSLPILKEENLKEVIASAQDYARQFVAHLK